MNLQIASLLLNSQHFKILLGRISVHFLITILIIKLIILNKTYTKYKEKLLILKETMSQKKLLICKAIQSVPRKKLAIS